MNKVLLSALVVLAVLWNSGAGFAQGRGRHSDTAEQQNRTRAIREDVRQRHPEPNDPRGQADAIRQRTADHLKAQRERRRQRLLRMREKRRAEMEEAARTRDANKAGGLAKGKEHQQQMQQLQNQMAREQHKHMERLAKLKRIQELARQTDSKDTLARAQKLMQKEQRRFSLKRQRMDMRMRMLERMQGRAAVPPHERRLGEKGRGYGPGPEGPTENVPENADR
ncbi:MAG: hypothetical protein ACYS76_11745 [Planctomycetota bacterium]